MYELGNRLRMWIATVLAPHPGLALTMGLWLAVTCVSVCSGQDHKASPGLLAAWDFDQDSGGAVQDASGNGNTGAIKGGAEYCDGIKGKAIRFDGNEAFLACPLNAASKSADQLTIEAWIHPLGAHQHGFGGIINNVNGAANSRLLVSSQGLLLAQLHGSTEGVSGPVVAPDLWNYVVYVYDGKEEVWYLNGKRGTARAYGKPLPVGGKPVTIGWGYTGHEYYHFNGLIDEVRIHGRALSGKEIGDRFTALGAPLRAELARREAEVQRQIEALDFVDHGVPAQLATRRGVAATADADGKPLVLICTMDNYQRRLRSSLLVVDVERGTTEQYWHPSKTQPVGEVYSLLLASSGRFYTMFGRVFLEFDPNSRKWTFTQNGPGLAMSFTEAPDGTIYAATYPGSHLLMFDPKTRVLTNLGRLDKTEMYPRSLAVDDAGWVYCGIGVAKANLVAFNPKTAELRQIPEETNRPPGSGTVFRGVDGKAYGHAGDGKWYELFDGTATPVDKVKVARAPIKTGSQGSFFTDFPDGRKLAGMSLPEKWLDVSEPDSDSIRRIRIDYESEGPGILSIISGPDGRIYGSTGLPLHYFVYDPELGYLEDWGGIKHGAHYNAVAVQGLRIVSAAYCGGYLAYHDMTRPWTNERGGAPNPVFLGNWARDLLRPAALLAHPDGKHVIMGGYPAYGHCGGGLLFYNLDTDDATLLTHEQVISWHSTVALAALPDGNIVAGTSIGPGTGGHAVAKEGALYIMDWRERKIVYQTHVAHAKSVSEVKVGPDGLVYGFADGVNFFVFDPQQRSIVHKESLAQYGRTAGGQAPRMLLLGPDKQFYALFSTGVVRIAPGTFRHERVLTSPVPVGVGMAIRDGRIYFSSGSHLCSCRIGTPPEPIRPRAGEIGWTTFRSDAGRTRSVLAFQCSPTAPAHPYFDQNSFVIDMAGKWLVANPRLCDESGTRADGDYATACHNTVLIDGHGQDKLGQGELLDLFCSPGYQYALGDAAGAYPADKLTKFHRHIIQIRPDWYFVMDELTAPKPATFEWRLHSDVRGRMSITDKQVTVTKTEVRLDAFMLEPGDSAVDLTRTDRGGVPGCAVSTRRKSRKQTFLAALHTSFVHLKTEGVVEMGSLPIAESSGQESRVIRKGNLQGIFYRGKSVGDFVAFDITVPEADEYRVIGSFFQSPLYGIVQLFIDGKKQGAPYDGYAKGVGYLERISLGTARLEAGTHRFRYEVAGKNPASEKHLVGIVTLQLCPTDGPVHQGPPPLPGVSAVRLRGDSAFGAEIRDNRGSTQVIFSTEGREETVELARQRFAGHHSAVSLSPEGEVTQYALINGMCLDWDERCLFASADCASIALAWTGRSAKGMLTVLKPGQVTLFLPRLSRLLVRGKDLDLTDAYDPDSAILTLTLKPGAHPLVAELHN